MKDELKTESLENNPSANLAVKDWRLWTVWFLRVSLGCVFIASGLSKAIDLWGVVFKFEEYFTAWGWEMPQALTVMGAMMLCSAEFLLGVMLLLGNYRRAAVWLLLAVMVFMLPLSLYIWIEDPVSDCGCFGDYLKLSNSVTFWKNVAITGGLVFLAVYNRRVACVFNPYSQWLTAVAALVYVTAVELYGFNVQPLVDFRSFPVGTDLAPKDEDDTEFVFVYEKGGSKREFTTDSLPDSTWSFVDRHAINGTPEGEQSRTELYVTDEDGDDVTADVISPEGLELLVIVPQHERADLYYNSYINDLNQVMIGAGGSLVELTDAPSDSTAHHREYNLADFPSYRVESTVLKELSRGIVSVVFLCDGRIEWKRNLGSIDVESVLSSPDPIKTLQTLGIDGVGMLRYWTLVFIVVLGAIFMIDLALRTIINGRKGGRAKNKCVNLQMENNGSSPTSDKEDKN